MLLLNLDNQTRLTIAHAKPTTAYVVIADSLAIKPNQTRPLINISTTPMSIIKADAKCRFANAKRLPNSRNSIKGVIPASTQIKDAMRLYSKTVEKSVADTIKQITANIENKQYWMKILPACCARDSLGV